jgi:hypothetical protein
LDIGQKPLKVLKKHGITLRGQKKRPLTHAPSASGKKMNWQDAWKELRKQSVTFFQEKFKNDSHRDHRGHRGKLIRCTLWQKNYTLYTINKKNPKSFLCSIDIQYR